MEKYDVLFVGGGVSGSVGARFSAEYGLDTLLIEKEEVPRYKCCSAISFPYLEEFIGSEIPEEKLCNNQIKNVEMVTPQDKVLNAETNMLNFWRSTFDHWLNEVASDKGAEFRDGTELVDFERHKGGWLSKLRSDEGESKVYSKYLVAADGGYSNIRKKMRPEDFSKSSDEAAINAYFEGDPGELDPNTLYMIHKKKFSTLMFSWIYKKDDDWIIGTGADHEPLAHLERFYEYVEENYGIDGEIVSKKGYSSTQSDDVWLGMDDLLAVGDSASLIDLYRGVGMDVAALSARKAAKAISEAESNVGASAGERYRSSMSRVVRKKRKNDKKQRKIYESDKALEKSLSKWAQMRKGIKLMFFKKINTLLPPEKKVLLPP